MNPLADKFIGTYLCMLCIKACKRSKTRYSRHAPQKRTQQKSSLPAWEERINDHSDKSVSATIKHITLHY